MERLDYIRYDKEICNLVVQLSGGGAASYFYPNMDSLEVIRELRHLADLLERGVNARKLSSAPGAN